MSTLSIKNKAGSFSKAAENLYITQPALSISVKKIESSLGMTLFERGTKPLQLTEAGKIYIESVEKMLVLEEDMTSRLHDLHDMRSGSCLRTSSILLAVSPESLDLPCALSALDVQEGRHLLRDWPAIPPEVMGWLEYVILSEENNLHDRVLRIFAEKGIRPRVKAEIS